MTIIDFTSSRCTFTQCDEFTSGTTVFKANIRCDSSWDGLTKTAVWSNGTTTIDVPQSSWVDGVCTIPHEVLTAGSYVSVGLYGVDGTGAEVLRTNMCQLGNLPTRAGADPSGDASVSPTPTVAEQLLAAATNAIQAATIMRRRRKRMQRPHGRRLSRCRSRQRRLRRTGWHLLRRLSPHLWGCNHV